MCRIIDIDTLIEQGPNENTGSFLTFFPLPSLLPVFFFFLTFSHGGWSLSASGGPEQFSIPGSLNFMKL